MLLYVWMLLNLLLGDNDDLSQKAVNFKNSLKAAVLLTRHALIGECQICHIFIKAVNCRFVSEKVVQSSVDDSML